MTSPAAALWLRITYATLISIALVVALSPAPPPSKLPWLAGLAAGIAAGPLLYVAAARRRPRTPVRLRSLSVLLAKLGILGIWAANEEVVWRRVVLGELLARGAVPALAVSTVGFAFVHRARRGLHLGTGAAFGALYLATGALAASVAAHWVYNVLVGAQVDHSRLAPSCRPAPR